MLLGAHMSVAGGLSKAFERAEADGARSLQIFTRSARGWACKPLEAAERKSFRAEALRTKLPAIAHGSYLVNLASEDAVIREKSLSCVAEELRRCDSLGLQDLVYHPGSHPDAARGFALVAQALDAIHEETRGVKTRLCLEVTAGQGNCLGWRFEHLESILALTKGADRVSVCLDTCHLFAAGYDLTTRRGYDRVMRECDERIGLSRVSCFHLNDSKKGLGCRTDRHEEIGKGEMGLLPFKLLVNDERFEDTVAVLETPFPERYAQTLRLLEGFKH